MEISFTAYVNYRNSKTQPLCFLHAVEQARQGEHILTIVDEYDMTDVCDVCRHMRMEEDMQAKREILGEVEE